MQSSSHLISAVPLITMNFSDGRIVLLGETIPNEPSAIQLPRLEVLPHETIEESLIRFMDEQFNLQFSSYQCKLFRTAVNESGELLVFAIPPAAIAHDHIEYYVKNHPQFMAIDINTVQNIRCPQEQKAARHYLADLHPFMVLSQRKNTP